MCNNLNKDLLPLNNFKIKVILPASFKILALQFNCNLRASQLTTHLYALSSFSLSTNLETKINLGYKSRAVQAFQMTSETLRLGLCKQAKIL